MVLQQLPVVPIAQFETQAISAPRVHDLQLSAMGTFDASRVWLAAASS